MNFALLALGIAGAGAALAYTTKGIAAMKAADNSPDFDALFQKYGNQYGVDALLLKAVAMQESRLDPNAERINPPRDVSVGLMQILCLPDAEGKCANRFNVDGWQGMTFNALKDADTNVRIGAQILAWNLRQFGYPRGIAVYNSWSARNDPLAGPFQNQSYVNAVLSNYRALAQKG